MIRALIIENERDASAYLASQLAKLFSDVQVVAVCETVQQSLQAIRTLAPELVFMDIELDNGESSFDVLRQLSTVDFEIIFTTAYDRYAIQAIRFSALDFLTKPYDANDLVAAVEKFKNKRTKFNQRQIEVLLANLKSPDSQENTIAIPSAKNPNEYEFIKVHDIIYCQAASDLAEIHLRNYTDPKNDLIRLVSRTLKECDELLTPYGFIRIHRSFLVNRKHIIKYYTGKDKYIAIPNNKTLTISETYEKGFLRAIGKL